MNINQLNKLLTDAEYEQLKALREGQGIDLTDVDRYVYQVLTQNHRKNAK